MGPHLHSLTLQLPPLPMNPPGPSPHSIMQITITLAHQGENADRLQLILTSGVQKSNLPNSAFILALGHIWQCANTTPNSLLGVQVEPEAQHPLRGSTSLSTHSPLTDISNLSCQPDTSIEIAQAVLYATLEAHVRGAPS